MSEQSPFDILFKMAQRSQSIDVELPPKENTRTHENGLGFSLLGRRFVAPMSELEELLRVPQTTKLPGVKHFVVGVANVRGRLLIVLDLAAFFGEASKYARTQRRVLAYEEDDETFFGFLVDESLGMQHFPREAFSETVTDFDDRFAPYLDGSYAVGGTIWPVFSLARLAADPALARLAVSAA